MRLKKCTIVGFKSFAVATTINFDGSVVAIVGPNGCGKSNVVDAFRWVMGESSSHLRGEKLEDVLFAGTELRKPQNIVRVSLTFSGVQESLSLPFDELTVTRSYHRGGDSEYFINGKSARLKEMQMLFSGSGVGKDALAIFEQGKLDQIIYLQPQERRKLFDEAAGISRFIVRKKESLQKLKEVEQNSIRIQDVHREAQKKIEKLQKQAYLAEKNLQLQAEGDWLTKAQRLVHYRQVERSHRELVAQFEALQALMSEKEAQFQKTKEEHLASQEKLSAHQKEHHQVQSELWQLYSELKGNEVRLEEKRRRQEQLLKDKEKACQDSQQMAQEYALLQEQKTSKEKEREIASDYQKERLASLLQAKGIYGEFENRLADFDDKRADFQKERFVALEQVQAIALQIREKKGQMQTLEKEQTLLLTQQKEKEQKKEALARFIQEKEAQIAVLTREFFVIKQKIEENRESKKILLVEKEKIEAELQILLQAIQELEAKKEAWRQLEENKLKFCNKIECAASNSDLRIIELEKINQELEILLTKREEERLHLENVSEKERLLQEESVALEIAFRKKEMVHLTEKLVLQTKSEELSQLLLGLDHLQERTAHLEEEKSQAIAQLEIREKEYEVRLSKEKEIIRSLDSLHSEYEKEGQERKNSRLIVEQEQNAFQEALKKEREAIASVELLEQSLRLKEEAMKRGEGVLNQFEEERTRLLLEYEQLRVNIDEEKQRVAHFQNSLERLEREKENFQKAHKRLEEQLHLAEKSYHQVKEKRQRIELSSIQMLSQKKSLEQEGVEEVEIPSLTLQEMKVRQQEIAILINQSGPVNFASIDELKREAAEFAKVEESLHDILHAKEDLEQAIKLLEQESKKTFKSHFQQIRTHFQNHFALLFEGGEADLVMSKETDFFEAGIEIQARPPGKKMQKISLLSGGEKCLTALALLFAFFSVKSAPFCILDEVDAPLDESNVERFTTLLSQFTGQTQFIVVTHNKKTMASADILVGVSMEEKGVSKLLSLSFEKQKVEMENENWSSQRV